CVTLTHITLHCTLLIHIALLFCFLHSTFHFFYIHCLYICIVYIVFLCFYVVCLLYAPSHQKKFQVGVNLLGNKSHSDSDIDLFPITVVLKVWSADHWWPASAP